MTPRNVVLLGDCIERLRELDADSVDAIVCDPPYGLEFMGKAWDGFTSPQAFAEWCRQWAAEALRVLKAGGHLLAFGGTRTYHRLVCGVEDAGFEVRDTIAWLYGSGFPKSKNVGNGFGTALKPAHEPIVVARKPLTGTVAANVVAWGTGALNIDGCRVEMSLDDARKIENAGGFMRAGWSLPDGSLGAVYEGTADGSLAPVDAHAHPLGRWPANVAHDGSVEVLELFPKSSVTGRRNGRFGGISEGNESSHLFGTPRGREYAKDAGSAARFFYCAKASRADREAGLVGVAANGQRVLNSGSTGRTRIDGEWVETHSEPRTRANDHPTVKPHDLMRWLVRLVGGQRGSLVLDPFAGSGSTLRAAKAEGFDFLGIERDPHYYRLACLRAGLPDPGEVAA